MEPNYGMDLELADQFQTHFPTAKGRANLVRAIFRRVTTSASSEAGRAIYRGRCMDVRDLFAARMDPSRLPPISRQVEQVCAFDERIDSAVCKPVFNFTQKRLEVGINLVPADGSTPFALVIGISSVTANPELLNGD